MSADQVILSSTERPELEFHFEYIAPIYACRHCSHTYEYQVEIGPCPSCGAKPSQKSSEQDLQHAVTELKKGKLLALLKDPGQLEKTEPLNLYARWSRPLGQRQRGLIYCAYKRTTEKITEYLREKIPDLRIDFFHAGRENAERDQILQRFMSDAADGLDIIVATNAFGMGIDVRRLGFVIHFDTPGTPEAYYQEAGRAGRDSLFRDGKERAQCILLFHPKDLDQARSLSSKNFFSHYEIEDAYTAICQLYNGFEGFSRQESSIQLDHSMSIFASVDDIASLAGIEGEQVATLLHYLEYHTANQENGQPVLEREETASFVWQLKFERDYQFQSEQLRPNSRASDILRIFTESEEYQLSSEQSKDISARELADSLNWFVRDVETELLRLVRNNIITYENHGHFKFTFAVKTVYQKLDGLKVDLKNLFKFIANSRQEFEQYRCVTINLCSIVNQQGINTVPFDHLTHFLFMLSQESAGIPQLLERCKLATRSTQPGHYELKLWHRQRIEDIDRTINIIIESLRQAISVLEEQMNNPNNDDLWHPIDLFSQQFSYERRRFFHHRLILLATLGLLRYISDPALGQAMKIVLLQAPLPIEKLNIDLRSLRLQEQHTQSKRKLMQQYATAQKEYYARQFTDYFQGKTPLLDLVKKELRSDLTEKQRSIATLQEGTHVVRGPAGCGKTTTLTEHVKYLVNYLQVPIEHIMIATQYKAAEAYIAELLKDLGNEGRTAFSTTINSFGNKIFLQYRRYLLKPDGKPYYAKEPDSLKNGSVEELDYIKKALEKIPTINFADPIYQHIWPQDLELPQFRSSLNPTAIQEAINRLRQYGIFPNISITKDMLQQIIGNSKNLSEYPDSTFESQRVQDSSRISSKVDYPLPEYYAAYIILFQVLAEENRYTFEDQVLFALAILRTNPDILHRYQRYYQHIIIDELQDFSPAKVELLMKICDGRKNVMAFGDLCQKVIFDKNNMENADNTIVDAKKVIDTLKEEGSHAVKMHELGYHFRSTQEILDMASYIRNKIVRSERPLKSAQNKHGPKPTYVYTKTGQIAELIDIALEQRDRCLSISEQESVVFILGNKEMLGKAEKYLEDNKIPFSLIDGQKDTYQLPYIRNALLYLSLITDKYQNTDTERLLRYNIVPYFYQKQISTLKTISNRQGIALLDTISSPEHLRNAQISREQQESLQRHLEIIKNRHPDDCVQQLVEDLNQLSDGPLSLLKDQQERLEEVNAIFQQISSMTIKEAVEDIKSHITFLEKHQGRSDLVLTTIEHSKSQEFATVFILGIDKVFKKRLYVAVSRTKQRLFILGDKQAFEKNELLARMPHNYYTERDRTGIQIGENESMTQSLHSPYQKPFLG